jgi:site-specific recombinase XerD
VIAPAPSPRAQSAQEELIERYRRYLREERGLIADSVTQYARAAMLFLSECPGRELRDVSVAEVSGFMVGQCRRLSPRSAERLATGLRSFLGFALLEGLIDAPLVGAVPSAARWSGAALPRSLAPDELAALPASCDRRRATGRRDYAILVVLCRLGLRAAEVAALRLDDIDWRAGEILVRGKGRSEERLPLPADVGAAIAAYLRRGRPRRPEREVFLRALAPLRGLSPQGVSEVVRAASERAGLGSFGAHRLRHTGGNRAVAGWGVAVGGGSGASPPQHRHHRDLRQGRPSRAAGAGQAVAGVRAMTDFRSAAIDYLATRPGHGPRARRPGPHAGTVRRPPRGRRCPAPDDDRPRARGPPCHATARPCGAQPPRGGPRTYLPASVRPEVTAVRATTGTGVAHRSSWLHPARLLAERSRCPRQLRDARVA